MRRIALSLLLALTFSATATFAEEHGTAEAPAAEHGSEGGEHGKAKPPEKPKPDSVISSVLSLPVVKQWADWMEAKNNGNKLVAWGEFIKDVKGSKCWSIVVAEENTKGVDTVWKRFCMQQTGLEMWVESMLGAANEYEPNYISYDRWMKDCQPTYNSPGKC